MHYPLKDNSDIDCGKRIPGSEKDLRGKEADRASQADKVKEVFRKKETPKRRGEERTFESHKNPNKK